MKKFILLNGPPRSGKDTAASIILNLNTNSHLYKMTSPMDEAFKSFFAISNEEWNDYREVNKDRKQDRFGGHTTREALIQFSEHFAKPLSGKRVFGKLAILHTSKLPHELIVVSDTGFSYEVEPLIEHYGPSNFLLLRLHRAGFDYSNDSRSYVTLDNRIEEIDINNEDINTLIGEITKLTNKFIGK